MLLFGTIRHMLRVTDGHGAVVVEIEGKWLHPVLYLFDPSAASVRETIVSDPRAQIYDSVVGTAALSCFRLLGARRVLAGLASAAALRLAEGWNMHLSADTVVEAIACASEEDVRLSAEREGGLPDPMDVRLSIERRAEGKRPPLTVRMG